MWNYFWPLTVAYFNVIGEGIFTIIIDIFHYHVVLNIYHAYMYELHVIQVEVQELEVHWTFFFFFFDCGLTSR